MTTAMERPGGLVPVLITLALVGAIVALGAIILPKPAPVPAARISRVKAGLPTLAVVTGFIPTFGQALTASGLAEQLKSPGPFTVFAPDEAAFSNLPAGTLENLLKPENQTALRTLIGYHIVPGKFTLADLRSMTQLQTLDGAVLEVRFNADGVAVNGVRITAPDMRASNGIVHIVGAVLHPPD